MPASGAVAGQTGPLARTLTEPTIRAFHYTRLTDAEVGMLRRDGVPLSTPVTLRTRLAAVVVARHLTAEAADMLYAASSFHGGQLAQRSDKFRMTSQQIAIDDGGVRPLLAQWGGEVAPMWVEDPALLAPLATAGVPRVIELAVPTELTHHGPKRLDGADRLRGAARAAA